MTIRIRVNRQRVVIRKWGDREKYSFLATATITTTTITMTKITKIHQ